MGEYALKCPRCGSDNPDGVGFCGYCGEKSVAGTSPSAATTVPSSTGKPPPKWNSWKILSVAVVALLVISNSAWVAVKISDGNSMNDANERIDRLESDYQEEQSKTTDLQSQLSTLQTTIDDLDKILATVPELELNERLRIGSLGSDYYQTIREEVGPQSIDWRLYGGDWQDDVEFCANLAMHDECLVYWPTYEGAYYNWYGTHSYDDALAKLQYVLSYVGITSTNTTVEKIEAIQRFVSSYIEYQADMIDKFFAPVETLSYRSGDCDDFSILSSALFEVAGIDSAIGFFTDAGKASGHAMVLVHLNDLGPYSYTYYSDLTTLGLTAGQWIVIEPQSVIQDQSGDWFDGWYLEVAAET